MAKNLKLTSSMPPSVNHYLGYRAVPSGKWKNGKEIHIVVPYLTKEAKEYKADFSKYGTLKVKEQGWDIEKTREKHHYMDCIYYFPRIDMDEQNYPKCMSDSLNGIAYIDDNFILTRTNRIYYDSKNPRVEIIISPVDYTGIFDSDLELVEFESNCTTCSRYKNNCSILKKAKEGRIQEEIDEHAVDLKCEKYKIIKEK